MLFRNKNKITKKYWCLSFFLTLLFLLTSFFQHPPRVQADQLDDLLDEACKDLSEKDCEDLKKEADDKESEFDTLENQLKNAQKLAKLKKQQAQTLAGQVQFLNSEISNVQGDISSLQQEINSTQENIDELKKQLDKRQETIKESQKSLGEMLRNYYKINESLGLSLLSKEIGMNEVFTQSDYLDQISTKINNILKIIREEKAILAERREEHEVEKGKLDSQKSELDDEKQSLAIKKGEKNNLLVRTQGEEAGYQALIAKIESQMKQLLIDVDSLSAAEQGALSDILKNAKKPEYGKADTNWYYSQRNKSWANDEIAGIDGLTMDKYGCAISAVAMVFTYHGKNVKPDDIAKKTSAFENDGSLRWSYPASKYSMELVKRTGHSTSYVDWDEIDDLIEKKRPVIVFISGSGLKGHYVVIHGYDKKNKDYVVHDPYWGANLLLGTSKKLVSSLYKRTAKVDQMVVYK